MINNKILNKLKKILATYMVISMLMLNLVPVAAVRAQEAGTSAGSTTTESTATPTPTETQSNQAMLRFC